MSDGFTNRLIGPYYAEVLPSEAMFGIHPHSGIGTLTIVLSGEMVYEDTTGKSGILGKI